MAPIAANSFTQLAHGKLQEYMGSLSFLQGLCPERNVGPALQARIFELLLLLLKRPPRRVDSAVTYKVK